MTRQRDVETLAVLVAGLVDEFKTTEIHEWRPTREGLAATDPAYLEQVREPDGRLRYRRPLPKPERRVHRTREPGVLEQLRRGPGRRRAIRKASTGEVVDAFALIADLAPTPGQAGSGGGSRGKPTSRPPAQLHATETLLEMRVDIVETRARIRGSAGLGRGENLPPTAMVRELLDLALRQTPDGWLLDDAAVRRLVRAARSWSMTARLALSYDAPVVTLRDRHCGTPEQPGCGGNLRVRQDASSDVWCAGVPGRVKEGPALPGEPWPIPDRGCGATWPRLAWIDLLDTTEAG